MCSSLKLELTATASIARGGGGADERSSILVYGQRKRDDARCSGGGGVSNDVDSDNNYRSCRVVVIARVVNTITVLVAF